MAESLAILGIASNVFQVVDVGTRILLAGWKASSSVWGTVPRNAEIEKDAASLKELLSHLRDSPLPPDLSSSRPVTVVEKCLRETISGCQKTAEELLTMLSDFHVDGDYHRKRKSIWNAFRSEWKRSVIDEKKARLDEYKRNISLILLQVLKDGNSMISTDIRNLTNELQSMGVQLSHGLNGLKLTPLKIVESLELMLISNYGTGYQGIGTNSISNPIAISTSAPSKDPPSTDQLLKLFDIMVLRRNEAFQISKILASLSFNLIDARRSEIKDAEFDTFKWIFTTDSSPFLDWLRSSSGIFWIAGKAGSGKSTLMRYLSEQSKTKEALSGWSNNCQVVIASFFFWNSGTQLQTSQEGLLRSLLFEIFSQLPSIVERMCPRRWHDYQFENAPNAQWTRTKLLETFQRILNAEDLRVKFCLFIDGLDEYVGDHGELVELLQAIPSTSNIKICVSSRPWNEFRNAWDHNTNRRFYLEDLTRNDVRTYVTEKLKKSKAFQEVSQESERSGEVIEEIVEKAHGVFLWVFLVVRSLLRGLGHGDKISDLQTRLREFPSELEDYFKHMIASIEERYKRETCQLFRIALSVRQPVPLITYSFLDEENPDFAVKMKDEPFDDSTLFRRLDRARKRINARCRDLLDVNESPRHVALAQQKVGFLHRTVRDFLALNEMRRLLHEQTPSSFNLHLVLCKAFLATIKTLPPTLSVFTWDRFLSHLVENAMIHVQELDLAEIGKEERNLLRCVYRSMMTQAKRLNDAYGQSWTHPGRGATLIEFAVGYGLSNFIKQELKPGRNKIAPDTAAMLLYASLFGGLQSQEHNPDAQKTSIPVLTLFLDQGLSPNVSLNDIPLWELFMDHISKHGPKASEKTKKVFSKAIEILLLHGAIPTDADRGVEASKRTSVRVVESTWPKSDPERQHLIDLINGPEDSCQSETLTKNKGNKPQQHQQETGLIGKFWNMVGYG